MEIDEIKFETVCCGHCDYAEITVSTGFAAVSRDMTSGQYTVRTYGPNKMPTGALPPMDEGQFAEWLSQVS